MDRNWYCRRLRPDSCASLSARRAWIEISSVRSVWAASAVALRKESVDRNRHDRAYRVELDGSLSARRAWIEIA